MVSGSAIAIRFPAELKVCEKLPARSSAVGTVVMLRARLPDTVFLPVRKEEGLVLLDGTADRAAELILNKGRPGVLARLKEVVGVQLLVPQKLVEQTHAARWCRT